MMLCFAQTMLHPSGANKGMNPLRPILFVLIIFRSWLRLGTKFFVLVLTAHPIPSRKREGNFSVAEV